MKLALGLLIGLTIYIIFLLMVARFCGMNSRYEDDDL
jgi:hypothetical protein